MNDFTALAITLALAVIPLALFFVALYFVIKTAVKAALRESEWTKF